MQPDTTSPFDDSELRNGVCVADGWGIKIHVRNGHLIVEDGSGSRRRQRRYHKATSGLTRVVIIGRSGYLTFEAVRWLSNAKVPYIHLDTDGTILATSVAGADKPALRRAQALAASTGLDVQVARTILAVKVEGQRDVGSRLGGTDAIENAIEAMDGATDLDSLRNLEAQAAVAYWELWAPVEATFNTRDRKRVPDHWLTFGQRGSTKANGGRKAINPINAILNYLYALLEAETRIALLAVGLDPGYGVIHADLPARDNFALDVMEVGRPEVDGFVLDFLEGHILKRSDFSEQPDGTCRLGRILAHRLSETSPIWRDAVAATVETVSDLAHRSKQPSTTPLTQSNRRRAQGTEWTATATPRRVVGNRCPTCGRGIDRRRTVCDDCVGTTSDTRAWLSHGREQLARLREGGSDPAHGGDAALRRASSMLEQNRISAEWDLIHERPDPQTFERDIRPHLETVPLKLMSQATGLSIDYCSKIRRGLRVPHPRHWLALEQVAEG